MELLSGNEAIARGAWEAGVRFASAYPGTPSTETLEALGTYDNVYAEWATNEKVAVESAVGASIAGARVLSTMKHVGVNVAADPLFTAACTGVHGGMVVLAADDPGMYSSQNEQDSHYYAAAAKIPMLDPANSQEAYQFTKDAFELSERFDVPFFIRSSVRISHTKTPVQVGERVEVPLKNLPVEPSKWVMMPAFAKPRRTVQLQRIDQLEEWVETCPYNQVFTGSKEIGVICTGAAYQHVREALPDASIFKLGVSWPLPKLALYDFAESVDAVYVVEEGSTYLIDAVRATGVAVSTAPYGIPYEGELTVGIIKAAFGRELPTRKQAPDNLPGRPPALCAGCPHRVVFRELSRMKALVMGDIGCYTLGTLAPLSAMHACIDMGASVSMAHGYEVASEGTEHRPVVSVIGDSTFGHSGLSSLISTVYNCGQGTVCILDNRTTAMTGRQGNPFNGVTLQNRPSRELDLEGVVRALGINDVRVIDPYVVQDVRQALKEAASSSELSVLIFRHPCVLLTRKREAAYSVTADCTACGACSSLGCPAISKDSVGHAHIDDQQCIGCGQCAQYCGAHAIQQLTAGNNFA